MKTTKIFEGLFIVMLLFIFVSCVQDYTEESVIPEKPEDPIEEPIVDKDYDWKKECRAVSTCIIPAKSKINCSSGRYLFSPEYDAYLTFVDPTPYVSIDRDFLYIFEDVAKTKKDTVLNDAGFPVALNDGPITNELMVVINGNKYYSVTSSDETGQTKAAITRSLAGSNATLLDYAIVIDGGKNMYEHNVVYYNNVWMFTYFLKEYLRSSQNAYLLISDGTSSSVDSWNGSAFVNSGTSFVGGISTSTSATSTNISAIFSGIGNIASNNIVAIYITGPSFIDSNTGVPCIWLWDEEPYTATQLATQINKIAATNKVNIIIETDYSGAFIPYLNGTNRTITTSCSNDETILFTRHQRKKPGANHNISVNLFSYCWALSQYPRINASKTMSVALLQAKDSCGLTSQISSSPSYYNKYYSIVDSLLYSPSLSSSSTVLEDGEFVSFTIDDIYEEEATIWSYPNSYTFVSSTDSTLVLRANGPTTSLYSDGGVIQASIFINSNLYSQLNKAIYRIWSTESSFVDCGIISGYANEDGGSFTLPENYPGAYGYNWRSDYERWFFSFQGYFFSDFSSDGEIPYEATVIVSFYTETNNYVTVSDTFYF